MIPANKSNLSARNKLYTHDLLYVFYSCLVSNVDIFMLSIFTIIFFSNLIDTPPTGRSAKYDCLQISPESKARPQMATAVAEPNT